MPRGRASVEFQSRRAIPSLWLKPGKKLGKGRKSILKTFINKYVGENTSTGKAVIDLVTNHPGAHIISRVFVRETVYIVDPSHPHPLGRMVGKHRYVLRETYQSIPEDIPQPPVGSPPPSSTTPSPASPSNIDTTPLAWSPRIFSIHRHLEQNKK